MGTMTTKSDFARELVSAGVGRKTADAIAEVMSTHMLTKGDIARLSKKIDSLIRQMKIITGMLAGLYVGIAFVWVFLN